MHIALREWDQDPDLSEGIIDCRVNLVQRKAMSGEIGNPAAHTESERRVVKRKEECFRWWL
mgnify:CR=1 FL=1